MYRLLEQVLSVSLSSAPFLLALLILHGRLGRRYRPHLRCSLWLLAALRMALPFSPGWAKPVQVALPLAQGPVRFAQGSPIELVAAAFSGEMPAGAAVQETQGLSVALLLPMLWAAGCLLFWGWHLLANLLAAKRLLRWSVPVSSPQALALYAEARRDAGVTRVLPLLSCRSVSTPMLAGFIRPVILLPGNALEEKALRQVLHHELTHYRRGDLWRKLLLLAACGLHWFNPLVHLMLRRAQADMELACDAEVLRLADTEGRRQYGLAVLSFAQPSSYPFGLTAGLAGGKKELLRRFAGILTPACQRRGLPVLALFAITLAAGGGLVACSLPLPALAAGASSQGLPPTGYQSRETQVAGEIEELEARLDRLEQEDAKAVEASASPRLADSELSETERQARILEQKLFTLHLERLYLKMEQEGGSFNGGAFFWPLPGLYNITSNYGWRFNNTDFHTGIDISGPDAWGKEVSAASGGVVRFANTAVTEGVGYGQYVILDHGGGVTTVYAQLDEVLVGEGDTVFMGQVIGKVGQSGWATGPHLHFEVRENGSHVHPASYFLVD